MEKELVIGKALTLKLSNIKKEQVEEILNKKSDDIKYEIEVLKDESSLVKIKFFRVGEQELVFGNTHIIIEVKSSIKETETKIYEKLEKPLTKKNYEGDILFYGGITIILIILAIQTKKMISYFRIKKLKKLEGIKVDPRIKYEEMLKILETKKGKDFIFLLSIEIRRYISALLDLNLLNGNYDKVENKELKSFLEKLEGLKYSISENEWKEQELMEKLLKEGKNIVGKIEKKQKEKLENLRGEEKDV